jgi:SAM-dependent methyltransferase
MKYEPTEFWGQRLTRDWSLRGVGHAGYSEYYNRYIYRAKVRALRRTLRQHRVAIAGKHVLDVGAGIGFWLRWYQDAGASQLTAIEISEAATIRLGAKFPSARVWSGDVAEEWPWPERFDLINAFDVLYHIVDRARFLNALIQMTRHLEPGGYLVVTDVFPPHEVRPGQHVCFHALKDYQNVLDAAACSILSIRPLYGLMNGVVFDRLAGSRRRWRKVLRGLENMAAPLLYALDGLWIPAGLPNTKLLIAHRSAMDC